MIYQPVSCVWEVTMGCNMRCKHCGSSCENALTDELTIDEALKLCDDIANLGIKIITLSGGEPTTRKDWNLIAKRLHSNGVWVSMITNGWLINEEILEMASDSGIRTIAISLDGLEDTHDLIRKKGSFQKIMHSLDLIKNKNILSAIITTLNKKNIPELPLLKEVLINKGVTCWQLQLGLPMGNMLKNSDWVAEPYHTNQIINFAHETMKEGKIRIDLADCIGYYNAKDIEVKKNYSGNDNYTWCGCSAGKCSIGLLHNGDVLGCTSVRDRTFIEGNIRNTPLKEIWENPDNFSWNRNITKVKLSGFCAKCQYGNYCHGGCSNTKLTMEGNVYAENKYCSYNYTMNKTMEDLNNFDSDEEVLEAAKRFVENNVFQLAEMLLAKLLEKHNDNIELLNYYGYVSFSLENYSVSKNVNERVIELDPQNAYAYKGLGLSLCKLGNIEQGIDMLKKSISLTDDTFLDPYYDLAVILWENSRKDEAFCVLEQGRKRSKYFEVLSQQLYEELKGLRK